jgi:hypothetical protein
MLGVPRSGSKVWEALDPEIGKSGENRGQIIAHWEFQPATAALLRPLEGNATDCAASILLRISSRRGLALA